MRVSGLMGLVIGVLASLLPQRALGWDLSKSTTNLGVLALTPADLKGRNITRISMGELVLQTGEIVVCDPLVTPDRPPLTRKVKPGLYPVTLFEAEGRIALAMLTFEEGAPVSWELATIEGQNVGDLKDDQIFGYPVDAGLGSFMDKTTYARMLDREALEIERVNSRYVSYYDNVLADELPGNVNDYVMHRPISGDDANIAIFSSGWGDGFYPSFWGLDAVGKPLVLVTDFYVLENGKAPSPDPAASENRP